MKIVVLDGFTLNPGDLTWADIEALGDCTIYDRTLTAQVVERACEADIVLTNKTPLNAGQLAQLPRLRLICLLATGFNIVDTAFARERGISVSNVPAYSTPSVAQMTFALLLELAQRAGHHGKAVREGRWSASPDFAYWDGSLTELDGLTMGLIGYGSIGQAVARIARAFGMRVIAHVLTPREADVELVGLEALLQTSDVVSLHCPLTARNYGMIDRAALAMMKPTAFLINTARGALIEEQALADALDSGKLAGAGLDVLSTEPPPSDHPLLLARNCLITPHIAWATHASRTRLMKTVASNIRAYLSGSPQNVVN